MIAWSILVTMEEGEIFSWRMTTALQLSFSCRQAQVLVNLFHFAQGRDFQALIPSVLQLLMKFNS